jgi:hypothetical protein
MDQDRLIGLCEAEFTDQVETLFRKLKLRKKLLFVAPLIGGIYASGDAAAVKRLVYKALIARKSFAINRPLGSRPPPCPLPLHHDAIDRMLASPYPSSRLQAYYARSQKRSDWDPRHPAHDEFCDRLLWSPNCPLDLAQEGRGLPEPLPGFDDETLCWFPPSPPADAAVPPIFKRIVAGLP